MSAGTATALAIGIAGATGAASLYSAKKQSDAAKSAAKTQTESADKAIALQRDIFQQQMANQAPFRDAGVGQLGNLTRMANQGYQPSALASQQMGRWNGMPVPQQGPSGPPTPPQGPMGSPPGQAPPMPGAGRPMPSGQLGQPTQGPNPSRQEQAMWQAQHPMGANSAMGTFLTPNGPQQLPVAMAMQRGLRRIG